MLTGATIAVGAALSLAYPPGESAHYIPGCRVLTRQSTGRAGQIIHYRPPNRDCSGCPVKENCTAGRYRTVSRHLKEDARERAKALQGTDPYERSRRECKKVEMLFAHLKRHLGLRRLKLQGLAGAAAECLLAATVQNLRRLVRLRPPDMGKICLPTRLIPKSLPSNRQIPPIRGGGRKNPLPSSLKLRDNELTAARTRFAAEFFNSIGGFFYCSQIDPRPLPEPSGLAQPLCRRPFDALSLTATGPPAARRLAPIMPDCERLAGGSVFVFARPHPQEVNCGGMSAANAS
jgi:hypothetical protein